MPLDHQHQHQQLIATSSIRLYYEEESSDVAFLARRSHSVEAMGIIHNIPMSLNRYIVQSIKPKTRDESGCLLFTQRLGTAFGLTVSIVGSLKRQLMAGAFRCIMHVESTFVEGQLLLRNAIIFYAPCGAM